MSEIICLLVILINMQNFRIFLFMYVIRCVVTYLVGIIFIIAMSQRYMLRHMDKYVYLSHIETKTFLKMFGGHIHSIDIL